MPARPLPSRSFDVVVVGGGIGGASLAVVLAQAGMNVALVERTREYKDRVHGEALAPWGVSEARRLGLLDVLLERARAHWLPIWTSYDGGEAKHSEIGLVDPHGESILSFHHPRAQAALWGLAQAAGVSLFRPAQLTDMTPDAGGYVARIERQTIRTRLLVGADGRASTLRRTLGGRIAADSPSHTVSGLLLAGTRLDHACVITKRVPHGRLLLFPIGNSHVRVYYMADRSQRARLSGSRAREEILAVCRQELDRGWFSAATVAGPGATFPNACRWVPHPNSEGLVLIGDAAGTGDPSIGQGLAVTMRDIGELSRRLIESASWTQAGTDYGRTRLRYFQTQRMIARCTWKFDAPGPEGERLRKREGRGANRSARQDLMRRIRLDPALVVPGKKARQLILYG